MLTKNNQYTFLRRELGAALLGLLIRGELESRIDALPVELIPRDTANSRCCIYKDRAMIRSRILALLGFDPQLDDEITPLSRYAGNRSCDEGGQRPVLVTIPSGCSSCTSSQYRITELCRGCVARPCITNCPKDAVHIRDGKAHIDTDLCINCGKCQAVCPFHAVMFIPVPCEDACPVGAIGKNEHGEAVLDEQLCIECGVCSRACPFGAITECSQVMETAERLLSGDHVTAVIAPSIEGQFPGSLEQIVAGLHALGFDEVVEAAEGAMETVSHESRELADRSDEPFMTSSCCPAYTACVKKHIPDLEKRVSRTPSPLAFSARAAKKKHPQTYTVFIGPCIAKKREGLDNEDVDAVITFEELASCFLAFDVDVHACRAAESRPEIGARRFAASGGVAASVAAAADGQDPLKVMQINGITRKSLKLMQSWSRRAPDAGFIEVMCCEEGCIGGPGCISDPRLVKKRASFGA